MACQLLGALSESRFVAGEIDASRCAGAERGIAKLRRVDKGDGRRAG